MRKICCPLAGVCARALLLLLLLNGSWMGRCAAGDTSPLRVLFLGDQGHHQPALRYADAAGVLRDRGIELVYTDRLTDINPQNLAAFDALLVYANIDEIEPERAQAILDYVAAGHGFVPLHCASFCFRNSEPLVALMGGQFKRHGKQVFRTELAERDHPIMQGFGGFESWDETYIHDKHNPAQRSVLEYRVQGDQAAGVEREPWTWVRTHGAGRVFYTAWGHDERTWTHPGFLNLLERGVLWACDSDPAAAGAFVGDDERFPAVVTTGPAPDASKLEFVDVGPKIPNYTAGPKWGAQEAPRTLMQQPLTPAQTIKQAVVPEGFHLELFVSEPDLGGKPIFMTWDERGRLWVCETYDYPNELQAPGTGRDRIRICEDTDHDGRADRFTVFAERLSIPSTLTFSYGGVICQDGTETLFLKDTTGDDVADVREVLLTGWNMNDTHGGVSNFQFGLDNWFWAMQGYNDSQPAAKERQFDRFRMGFFRFRVQPPGPAGIPSIEAVEFMRSGHGNSWGVGLSEEGLAFGSSANRAPSLFMPIANRYYESVRGWTPNLSANVISDTHLFHAVTDDVRQVDHHGGYTAAAGHALYTAREYPQEYWNRTAFVCGPTGHLVGGFVLSRDGANYRSTNAFNLYASHDSWSAPIMAEVGPDGNMWILDWYNYIVQHNPTPQGFETGKGKAYETDLRDKSHGRVYRLVRHESVARPPISLASATTDDLVATLQHTNFFWRRQAQRLLLERQDLTAVPGLIALLGDASVDAVGINPGAIHAAWTLAGLHVLDRPEVALALTAALKHPAPGVRRNAALVSAPLEWSGAAILAARLMDDPDAQVRLAALLSLAEGGADAAVATGIANQLMQERAMSDATIRDAVTCAAARNAEAVIRQLIGSSETLSAEALKIVSIVSHHWARSEPAAQSMADVLTTLPNTQRETASAVVVGLAGGWPKDRRLQLTAAAEAVLPVTFETLTPEARGSLVRLTQQWGVKTVDALIEQMVAQSKTVLSDESATDNDREAAARQLVSFLPDSDAVVVMLAETLTPRTSPELSEALLAAMATSRGSSLGETLVSLAVKSFGRTRAAALTALMSRAELTSTLLAAIADGKLSWRDLRLDQQQALATHPDSAVRKRARELLQTTGTLISSDRAAIVAEYQPATLEAGNVANGKLLFTQKCANCHRLGSEGKVVGPDLTGMAVHPRKELLAHILDPSGSVEANYRSYLLVTAEGQTVTGLLSGESRTSVELLDAEGKLHAIPREEILEFQPSPKSLMPEGFEKQFTVTDMRDLLEFLTQKGKFVPLDLRKVASVVSTRGMFQNAESRQEAITLPEWGQVTVAGVPFLLIDPQGTRTKNMVLLRGPRGPFAPQMPESVQLPVQARAAAIHVLGGVGGWSFPATREPTVSMSVVLTFEDGGTERHDLINGVHLADYVRQVDVPESAFAMADTEGQQLRYIRIPVKSQSAVTSVELVKGNDVTAPLVAAITLESP